MAKPEVESVSIRFPANIKRWLEKAAAANFRSQNAQVLAIVQDAMHAQQVEKAVRQ